MHAAGEVKGKQLRLHKGSPSMTDSPETHISYDNEERVYPCYYNDDESG